MQLHDDLGRRIVGQRRREHRVERRHRPAPRRSRRRCAPGRAPGCAGRAAAGSPSSCGDRSGPELYFESLSRRSVSTACSARFAISGANQSGSAASATRSEPERRGSRCRERSITMLIGGCAGPGRTDGAARPRKRGMAPPPARASRRARSAVGVCPQPATASKAGRARAPSAPGSSRSAPRFRRRSRQRPRVRMAIRPMARGLG